MSKKLSRAGDVVFLLDVDNTLLDNDRFSADLDARLQQDFGSGEQKRYRRIYGELRGTLGYADYLGAVQALRDGLDDDPDLLRLSAFILDYPFADRLYPHALDAVAHLDSLGTPVILSDGDIVLQPRKVQRSGLWDAVDGRVLIYLHKERRLDAVRRHCPARHYVMVEDKPQLLAAMKREMGAKLTTVLVRQGHYAREQTADAVEVVPDITLERIADLRGLSLADYVDAAAHAPAALQDTS